MTHKHKHLSVKEGDVSALLELYVYFRLFSLYTAYMCIGIIYQSSEFMQWLNQARFFKLYFYLDSNFLYFINCDYNKKRT